MKRLSKSLSQKVRSQFIFVKTLGAEGKDGQVFLVKDKKDTKMYAMKVFKANKSLKNIQKEIDFQKSAAKKGLAPTISTKWKPDSKNKFFVMQPLKSTLEAVISKQDGKLHMNQAKQIVRSILDLDDLKIVQNDNNIGKNMMSDSNGKFFFIDFGMAKHSNKTKSHTNIGLLAQIDRLLTKSIFKNFILEFEKTHGIVDPRAAVRRKIEERKMKILRQMKGGKNTKYNAECQRFIVECDSKGCYVKDKPTCDVWIGPKEDGATETKSQVRITSPILQEMKQMESEDQWKNVDDIQLSLPPSPRRRVRKKRNISPRRRRF